MFRVSYHVSRASISLESHHAPRVPPHSLSPKSRLPQSLGCAPTSALLLGVSPVVLLALGTDTTPETRPALALPCHLQQQCHAHCAAHWAPGEQWSCTRVPGHVTHSVTGRVQGVCGVAATGLTAPWSPQAPEVGRAAITALAHDVGPAGTGSCATVTIAGAIGAVGGQCTPWVTATACRRVGGHVGLSPYPLPRQCAASTRTPNLPDPSAPGPEVLHSPNTPNPNTPTSPNSCPLPSPNPGTAPWPF